MGGLKGQTNQRFKYCWPRNSITKYSASSVFIVDLGTGKTQKSQRLQIFQEHLLALTFHQVPKGCINFTHSGSWGQGGDRAQERSPVDGNLKEGDTEM